MKTRRECNFDITAGKRLYHRYSEKSLKSIAQIGNTFAIFVAILTKHSVVCFGINLLIAKAF